VTFRRVNVFDFSNWYDHNHVCDCECSLIKDFYFFEMESLDN